jgi:hypothetical protein
VPLEIAPTTTRMIAVRLRADPGDAKGVQKIEFRLQAPGTELREQSRFLHPVKTKIDELAPGLRRGDADTLGLLFFPQRRP